MGSYSVVEGLKEHVTTTHAAQAHQNDAKKIFSNYSAMLALEVGHGAYQNTETSVEMDDLATGVKLRLTAGQTSKITLKGVADWHFLSASLTLKNPARRLASPLNDLFESRAGNFIRTSTFDPPIHAHKLLTEGLDSYGITLTTASNFSLSLPHYTSGNNWVKTHWINGKVEQIATNVPVQPVLNHRAALILDNAPKGIALSTAQDQILHRVTQELAFDQSAQTPDISATLNGAQGDEITLNLLSQTDGVIEISGAFSRIRQTTGHTPDAPDHTLSPWHPYTITPTQAIDALPQTTQLTATLRAVGDAHLGLLNTPMAHFGIRPTPHLSIVQPFQPCPTPRDGPITLTGCWLFLSAPPETDTSITLSLNLWDSDQTAPGVEQTKTTTTLSARLMDHTVGPDGLIAAWVQFSEPVALDTPNQTLLHCLVLSEMDAPLRLIETPRTHAQLLPLRSKNTRRDTAWTQRDFASPDKALAFELGYQNDTQTRGELTIHHVGGTQTQLITGKETDFIVDLQHGPITFETDVQVAVSNIACTTQTAIFT